MGCVQAKPQVTTNNKILSNNKQIKQTFNGIEDKDKNKLDQKVYDDQQDQKNKKVNYDEQAQRNIQSNDNQQAQRSKNKQNKQSHNKQNDSKSGSEKNGFNSSINGTNFIHDFKQDKSSLNHQAYIDANAINNLDPNHGRSVKSKSDTGSQKFFAVGPLVRELQGNQQRHDTDGEENAKDGGQKQTRTNNPKVSTQLLNPNRLKKINASYRQKKQEKQKYKDPNPPFDIISQEKSLSDKFGSGKYRVQVINMFDYNNPCKTKGTIPNQQELVHKSINYKKDPIFLKKIVSTVHKQQLKQKVRENDFVVIPQENVVEYEKSKLEDLVREEKSLSIKHEDRNFDFNVPRMIDLNQLRVEITGFFDFLGSCQQSKQQLKQKPSTLDDNDELGEEGISKIPESSGWRPNMSSSFEIQSLSKTRFNGSYPEQKNNLLNASADKNQQKSLFMIKQTEKELFDQDSRPKVKYEDKTSLYNII